MFRDGRIRTCVISIAAAERNEREQGEDKQRSRHGCYPLAAKLECDRAGCRYHRAIANDVQVFQQFVSLSTHQTIDHMVITISSTPFARLN